VFARKHTLELHLARRGLQISQANFGFDKPFFLTFSCHLKKDIDIIKAAAQNRENLDASINRGSLAQNLLGAVLILPKVIAR
jgi:hypothetical protein